jgi:hypothetical protein
MRSSLLPNVVNQLLVALLICRCANDNRRSRIELFRVRYQQGMNEGPREPWAIVPAMHR